MQDLKLAKLVLENHEGKVIRAFQWNGEKAYVIRRADTSRLEVVPNMDRLLADKIDFENLGEMTADSLQKK